MRAVALLALAAAVFAGFVLRPHAVERWGLYLGSPEDARAQLFLDPFPSAASCELRVSAFRADAERAFCRSRLVWELGATADAVLDADFDPFSRAWYFCRPRSSAEVASRVPSGRSAAPRLSRP